MAGSSPAMTSFEVEMKKQPFEDDDIKRGRLEGREESCEGVPPTRSALLIDLPLKGGGIRRRRASGISLRIPVNSFRLETLLPRQHIVPIGFRKLCGVLQ